MDQGGGGEEKKRVCVTGAGGFLASWLVKLLLSKGYVVHGTVRDSSDGKNAHLKKLENASENMKLFDADLLDSDAFGPAFAGCDGVFHVASPVPSTGVLNPEIEVIAPAVTGTLNVLRACSEANVKKVVVVSSTTALIMNPRWPKGKTMDEDCWSDVEHCRKTESWYFLSKTLAEIEAVNYGAEHGLDIVTLCPGFVFGPMLQPTLNFTSQFLVNLIKGNQEPVRSRMIPFVDVRDVADALLLVYENPKALGRYICLSYQMKIRDLAETVKGLYPAYKYQNSYNEVDENLVLSPEKLKMLGWKSRPLEEMLVDSVECYKQSGLLNDD